MGISYIFHVGHNNQEVYASSGKYTYPAITGSGSDPYNISCLAVANGCTSAVASQVVTVLQLPDFSATNGADGTTVFNNCSNAGTSPIYDIELEGSSCTKSTNSQVSINWVDGTSILTVTPNFFVSNLIPNGYINRGLNTIRITTTVTNGCETSKHF